MVKLAPVGLIADHWRQVVGKDSGQGGMLPVRSLMARANSRIACWPFVCELHKVPPFRCALDCPF